MGIANFPSNLAAAIQQGYLDKRFQKSLTARLGYRNLAMKEPFQMQIGETKTYTRAGKFSVNTTPLDPTTNTGLDNGLTPQYWSVEQFLLSINEYADTMDLNIVGDKVGIASQFLINAENLGEQSSRSIDTLARNFLFGFGDPANQQGGAYLGGNTRVRTTLGSPNTTISVDDIRGFVFTIPTSGANSGRPNIPTSPTNTQDVQVGNNAYTLVGAVADVVNVSTAFGGLSGTLTFSTPVSVSDGTAGNAVISAFAPTIVRPNNRLTTNDLITTDILTLDVIRQAVVTLQNNGLYGPFTTIMDNNSWKQLYQDPEFQILFRGTEFKSMEYGNFKPTAKILDTDIVTTNNAPQQSLNSHAIRRPIVMSSEALIEGEFLGASAVLEMRYRSQLHDIREAEGIFLVTRDALDRLSQIIAQSWFYIGGWAVPTDQTTNPNTVPTANSSYYKRAVVIETA